MTKPIWRFRDGLLGVMATICSLTLAGAAIAQQSFPSRQITAIYPYTPGGGGDALFRLICLEAGNRLGQTIVIEPRPGGNARLGLIALQNAKGDAYLLSYISSNVIVLDSLRDPNFRVQPGKDYTPVTTLYSGPYIIVVSLHEPYRDLRSFIAYAKANPGKVNMGLASSGSVSQIIMQLLSDQEGFSFQGIFYKGEAPVWQALSSGDAHISVLSGGSIPQVQAGRFIAIATTTNQRLPLLPNVPTLAELGYSDFADFASTPGVVAASDIGAPVTNKLNAAFSAAVKVPEVVKRISEQGNFPGGIPAEEYANQIRSQLAQMGPVVAKMKFD